MQFNTNMVIVICTAYGSMTCLLTSVNKYSQKENYVHAGKTIVMRTNLKVKKKKNIKHAVKRNKTANATEEYLKTYPLSHEQIIKNYLQCKLLYFSKIK